jgi:hypothetical protein
VPNPDPRRLAANRTSLSLLGRPAESVLVRLGPIAVPKDVAHAVCFLFDTRQMNGVVLHVDGGEIVSWST